MDRLAATARNYANFKTHHLDTKRTCADEGFAAVSGETNNTIHLQLLHRRNARSVWHWCALDYDHQYIMSAAATWDTAP